MQYEMSRKKLRHYFGNVTYIDDAFDVCLIKEPIVLEDADDGGPPLPVQTTTEDGSDTTSGDVSIDLSGNNLRTLLDALNKEAYSGIRLNPIVYSENSREEQICQQMIAAPLTIIDWELGPNKNGFDIIQKLFSVTSQLKVIVVYSASFSEAMISIGDYPQLTAFPFDTSNYERFNAYKCNNSSLLIVADKQSYNINQLLDIISDLFIECYGIMPVALLDFMATCQQQSDKIFSALSLPLSDLYNLQMHFADKSNSDVSIALTQFIQHKLLGTCAVDTKLIEDYYEYQKNQLKNFIESPTASQKLSRCIATIQESLPDECKQFCESLSEVDFHIFEECTQKALSLGENWSKVLSYYSPFFKLAKKRYAEKKVELMLSPYASIEYPSTEEGKLLQHRKALITDVEKSIEKSFAGFKQQTLPVLIQMLISTDSMLQRGSDLVENLKYEFYQNADLNSMLADGCGLSRGKLAAFLFNKLHFGDILTRDAGDTTEFMLCMTPPCDILRPEKVNFNIVFIRGREIPICELSQERKENCHLSVLSIRNGESTSLRYVCWEFFNISRFDLMDEDDYKDLCTWERPFRMTESYVRQISNLFTAHFARAGVDEMFMKSASNLRGLFV